MYYICRLRVSTSLSLRFAQAMDLELIFVAWPVGRIEKTWMIQRQVFHGLNIRHQRFQNSTCEYIASEIITSYFLQADFMRKQKWGISLSNNDDPIDLPRSRMVEWNLVDGKTNNEQTIDNRFPSDKLYPSIQRMRSPQDVRHIMLFLQHCIPQSNITRQFLSG